MTRFDTSRTRFAIGLTALVVASAAPGAARTFEFKMISSGANRPGVALGSSPYREVLVGLHVGAPPSDLAAAAGLDPAGLARALETLSEEGVVAEVGGSPRPRCMVVTAQEGARLAALATESAREALPLMRRALGDVRARYGEIAGLGHLAFEDVSFFLASDVLLDNWQITAVERSWLRAERPLRGKARYYCALLERTGDREPFGIYGNQIAGVGGDRMLGVYGNRRGSGNDLHSLSGGELAELVAMPEATDRVVLLGRLLDEMQKSVENGTDLPPRLAAGLGRLGLARGARPRLAVLDTADVERLGAMAASVTEPLVGHLTGATAKLREAWAGSRWHEETTFEEFLIWWYHFFYTALTDRLAGEGMIQIPESQLFHYMIVE